MIITNIVFFNCAEYSDLIYAANRQARGLDSCSNKIGLLKLGKNTSETCLRLDTKVSEQRIMSYFREAILGSLILLKRPLIMR